MSAADGNTGNTPTEGQSDEHWKLLAKRSDSQDGSLVLTDVSTVETLTDLPVENYSIKASLSANSDTAISFRSTPAEGMEYMIDVKNNHTDAITVKLPNGDSDGTWQCDAEQITISAGKIASISVRFIHNTYVVLTRSF